MTIPKQSLASMFEDERSKVESEETRFQSDRDFNFLKKIVDEQSKLIGGTIDFFPVSTERNPQGDKNHSFGVDPLDGDILNPEFNVEEDNLKSAIKMRCLIEHEPPKQMLKKYGVDEQREIVFYIPLSILEEVGLVDDWRINGADIGDLIVWEGSWYQAWNVYRDHYFGQRSKSFYIACFCDRYRHDAVPINDVSDC